MTVRVRGLIAASFIAALTACTTTQPVNVAHISASASPVSSLQNLSRIAIAQNFKLTNQSLATPVNADQAGIAPVDPILKRHERDLHQNRREEFGAAHASSLDTSPAARISASIDLPAGWTTADGEIMFHPASGMRCPASINLEELSRNYVLRKVINFDTKERDVGCNYQSGDGVAITLFASFWPDMTLDQSVAGSVAGMMARFEVGEELTVMTAALTADATAEPGDASIIEGMEKPIAGGFDIGDRNGVRYKTSLWLVKTEGWHVKARATYPLEDQTSEIIAAILFTSTHFDVRKKNLAEPIISGAEV